MEGWNPHVFPMASTLLFKVPARGPGLPACDVFWHDGVGNHPELPAGFHGVKTDSNAPASLGGSDQGKALPPGKEIYGDGVVFKGGSHGSTLSVVGGEKADAVKARLPQVPKSPSNHYKNFLLGVKGEETCTRASRCPARFASSCVSVSSCRTSTPSWSSTPRPAGSPITPPPRRCCASASPRAKAGKSTSRCNAGAISDPTQGVCL